MASDEIDGLYALPLEEFTAARNRLARELRRDGRREEADEVSALRKPSVPAWLVNQLARRRRADVEALLDAASELRKGKDADAQLRAAVERLLRGAREIGTESGRRTADAVLHEVATTLRAAAAAAPDELAAGRLTESREASGFLDAFAGAATGAPPRREKPARPKPRAKPGPDPAALAAARQALSEAREKARELQKRATSAEREARRARSEADDAEQRVEVASGRLDALRAGQQKR